MSSKKKRKIPTGFKQMTLLSWMIPESFPNENEVNKAQTNKTAHLESCGVQTQTRASFCCCYTFLCDKVSFSY